jgi:hypothetical protein
MASSEYSLLICFGGTELSNQSGKKTNNNESVAAQSVPTNRH